MVEQIELGNKMKLTKFKNYLMVGEKKEKKKIITTKLNTKQ